MIQIMNLIKCRFAEKSHRIICGLTVLSLAMIAGGIGLVLIPLPAEGQSGKSLSEVDLKKIDDITQTAMNAALAKDFATWAGLFLDDAVVNPPNEPAVKGRAAIRAWLEKFPPITEFKLNNEKVEGREDLAYVLGTYTMTIRVLAREIRARARVMVKNQRQAGGDFHRGWQAPGGETAIVTDTVEERTNCTYSD